MIQHTGGHDFAFRSFPLILKSCPFSCNPTYPFLGRAFFLIIAMVIAVAIYIDFYIAIPPEFAGAKPRTAQLDLARDSFSAEMIRNLTDTPISDPNEKAFLTKPIDVLFAGSQYLIIDPAPEDPNSRETVEISRDAIKAVLWRRAKPHAQEPTPEQSETAHPEDASGL